MPRLIVVPIGIQLTAVASPLLSAPLRPAEGDVVALLDSEETAQVGAGSHLRTVLTRKLGDVFADDVPFVERDALPAEPLERLRTLACGREVWLLANGGGWGTSRDIIEAFADHDAGMRIAWSRDQTLHVIAVDGTRESTHPVEDVDQETLLEIVRAKLEGDALTTAAGQGHRIRGVEELIAAHGFLWATLDPRASVDSGRLDVDSFRRRTLDYTLLRRLGLETRRVFVLAGRLDPDRATWLRQRCLLYGIPVDATDFGVEAWRKAVASGGAFEFAERQRTRLPGPAPTVPRAKARNPGGTWSGKPLVVALGPQIGTTLEALWRREPSHVRIVYDKRQPFSALRAARLHEAAGKGEAGLGCATFAAVDLRELEGLVLPEGRPVQIEGRPGDKGFSVRLELWRRRNPETRLWAPDAGRHAGKPVPLEAWVRFAAPVSRIDPAPFEPTPTQRRAALGLLRDLAMAAGPLDRLNDLEARRRLGAPYVENARLVLSGESIPASELGSMWTDLLPSGTGQGLWWEWCVAVAVREAAARLEDAEVIRSYRTYRNQEAGEYHLDEVDVVTRFGRNYAGWSCKLTADQPDVQFGSARAQTDSLIGRGRTTVLAVPRRRTNAAHRKVTRYGALEAGYIVDSRFLVQTAEVAKLAAGLDPYPAPNRML